jgi:REP element-mobilizing transposase RayT
LAAFVVSYKSAVTTAINTLSDTPGFPVWQRNYYEHVIRNDEDLRRIRDYIEHNPGHWQSDRRCIPSVEIDS